MLTDKLNVYSGNIEALSWISSLTLIESAWTIEMIWNQLDFKVGIENLEMYA